VPAPLCIFLPLTALYRKQYQSKQNRSTNDAAHNGDNRAVLGGLRLNRGFRLSLRHINIKDFLRLLILWLLRRLRRSLRIIRIPRGRAGRGSGPCSGLVDGDGEAAGVVPSPSAGVTGVTGVTGVVGAAGAAVVKYTNVKTLSAALALSVPVIL
jgi:hypothetical protein